MSTNSTSDPEEQDLLDALEAIASEDASEIGRKAERLVRLRELKDRAAALYGEAYAEMLEIFEQQGLTAVRIGDRTVSITMRRNIRVAEGNDPTNALMNLEQARQWIERYNPQVTSVTQATLKATLDAYLETEGGDAPLPEFLQQQDVPSLSIRRS